MSSTSCEISPVKFVGMTLVAYLRFIPKFYFHRLSYLRLLRVFHVSSRVPDRLWGKLWEFQIFFG